MNTYPHGYIPTDALVGAQQRHQACTTTSTLYVLLPFFCALCYVSRVRSQDSCMFVYECKHREPIAKQGKDQ